MEATVNEFVVSGLVHLVVYGRNWWRKQASAGGLHFHLPHFSHHPHPAH